MVNVKNKLEKVNEYWSPKIVGELNDDKVQVVKLKGEFVWHKHEVEEELFFVIKGKLLIHFRDRTEEINEGEFLIVPKGIEHKPEAKEEVHIVLIEPKGTVNTGDAVNSELTAKEEKI